MIDFQNKSNKMNERYTQRQNLNLMSPLSIKDTNSIMTDAKLMKLPASKISNQLENSQFNESMGIPDQRNSNLTMEINLNLDSSINHAKIP